MDDLLELVTPGIYRRNPFHVLGLQIDATARDVQRAAERLKLELKLKLRTEPSLEDVEGALERLQRPVDRFLAEMFWYWPVQSEGDPQLAAPDRDQVDQATALWSKTASSGANSEAAAHNLAILYHQLALDDEEQMALAPVQSRAARLPTEWTRALNYWRDTLANKGFWSYASRRALEHRDPRLTSEVMEKIREVFPAALLRINGRIVLGAVDRKDSATISRNLRMMFDAKLGEGTAEDALRDTLQPMCDRVKSAIDTATAEWQRTPHQAHLHVDKMEKVATSVLERIDYIVSALPRSEAGRFTSLRNGLADSLVSAMLTGQFTYTDKTNDWVGGITILERAQKIAIGDSLRDRVADRLKGLREAAANANDWCAPGYWDLPNDTTAKLEAARAKTNIGDFDGALHDLLAMEASIGRPLRRAAAWCLSVGAIRAFNAALSEYDQDTEIRKRLWANILNNTSLIVRTPNPNMSSYMLPPCPCHGGTNYTSWVNFKMKDLPVWMCAACSDLDKRQIEEQKKVLRPKLMSALERLLLADEIDPNDPGVRRNLGVIQRQAKDFNCNSPSTTGLKKRLGARDNERIVIKHDFEAIAEDDVCFFCARSSPETKYRIHVPARGDEQNVSTLFKQRVTIREGVATVPRCAQCWQAHSSLTSRRKKWAEDTSVLQTAERDSGAAAAAATQSAARAAAASNAAEVSAARAITASIAADEAADAATAALVADASHNAAEIRTWLDRLNILKARRRRAATNALRNAERVALAKKRQAAELATRAEMQRQTAAAAALRAAGDAVTAEERHAHDKAALGAFQKANVQPTLPAGIRSEEEYLQFPRLRAVHQQGWMFEKAY